MIDSILKLFFLMGYDLFSNECEKNCLLQFWKHFMCSAVAKHYPSTPIMSVKVLNALAESSRKKNVEERKKTDRCEPQCL